MRMPIAMGRANQTARNNFAYSGVLPKEKGSHNRQTNKTKRLLTLDADALTAVRHYVREAYDLRLWFERTFERAIRHENQRLSPKRTKAKY